MNSKRWIDGCWTERTDVDICFVTRNQSLRIGSAVIRALEFTEHVHVLQLEDDETERNIAIESGGNVFHHSNWSTAPEIANSLKEFCLLYTSPSPRDRG